MQRKDILRYIVVFFITLIIFLIAFWFSSFINDYKLNDIKDIQDNFAGSKIRSNEKSWYNNMALGAGIYQQKWGNQPTQTLDLGLQNALDSIELIKERYSKTK